MRHSPQPSPETTTSLYAPAQDPFDKYLADKFLDALIEGWQEQFDHYQNPALLTNDEWALATARASHHRILSEIHKDNVPTVVLPHSEELVTPIGAALQSTKYNHPDNGEVKNRIVQGIQQTCRDARSSVVLNAATKAIERGTYSPAYAVALADIRPSPAHREQLVGRAAQEFAGSLGHTYADDTPDAARNRREAYRQVMENTQGGTKHPAAELLQKVSTVLDKMQDGHSRVMQQDLDVIKTASAPLRQIANESEVAQAILLNLGVAADKQRIEAEKKSRTSDRNTAFSLIRNLGLEIEVPTTPALPDDTPNPRAHRRGGTPDARDAAAITLPLLRGKRVRIISKATGALASASLLSGAFAQTAAAVEQPSRSARVSQPATPKSADTPTLLTSLPLSFPGVSTTPERSQSIQASPTAQTSEQSTPPSLLPTIIVSPTPLEVVPRHRVPLLQPETPPVLHPGAAARHSHTELLPNAPLNQPLTATDVKASPGLMTPSGDSIPLAPPPVYTPPATESRSSAPGSTAARTPLETVQLASTSLGAGVNPADQTVAAALAQVFNPPKPAPPNPNTSFGTSTTTIKHTPIAPTTVGAAGSPQGTQTIIESSATTEQAVRSFYESQLNSPGTSLTDVFAAYKPSLGLSASLAPNPDQKYVNNVVTQGQILLDTARAKNLPPADMAKIGQNLMNAVTIASDPSAMLDSNDAATLSDPTVLNSNIIYTGAASSGTYMPLLSNPAVVGNTLSIDTQGTMSLVAQQLANADANMLSHDEQLAALANINPKGYKAMQAAGNLGVLAAQKTPDTTTPPPLLGVAAPPPVSKSHPHPAPAPPPAPNPKTIEKIVGKATQPSHENLNAHQKDMAAIDAIAKRGGEWARAAFGMKYYMNNYNLPVDDTFAILGSAHVESGIDASRVQNGYGPRDSKTMPDSVKYGVAGYGEFQITYGTRQHHMEDVANHDPRLISDPSFQFDFSMIEARGQSYLDNMKNAKKLSQKVKIWMDGYESPGVPNLQGRIDYAYKLRDEFRYERGKIDQNVTKIHNAASSHESNHPAGNTITAPVANHAEYVLRVPNGGVGHDVYYVNQETDLGGFDSINGQVACGLTAAYIAWTSQENNPNLPAAALHQGLLNAGAYSDSAGILNTPKYLNFIQNNLHLKVHTIRDEKTGRATPKDLEQVRKALANGATIIAHTSNKVSGIDGGGTSGHFLPLYASDAHGNFYVANNGARIDSPKGGHPFTPNQIMDWLDGFYVVNN